MIKWYAGSRGAEEYSVGPCATREHAAQEYAELNDDSDGPFETGRLEVHVPHINPQHIIDQLCDDNLPESAEYWLDGITPEQMANLGTRLDAALHQWLADIGRTPTFGWIVDIEEHVRS